MSSLFEAFLAGFEASHEGFNGEYVGMRYQAGSGPNFAFVARMQREFDEWRERVEEEAANGRTQVPPA